MGLLSSIMAPAFGADYKPWDDFWYQRDPRFGIQTTAGITASAEASLKLGTVYACVRILADLVGTIPLHVYKRRKDGGKDRATDHPAYQLLRRRPNEYQTAIRWRQLGQRHVLLRGNFYNRIVWSTRRVRELLPFPEPDRMRVKLLDNGRRGYVYRGGPGDQEQVYTQDEIFHVMGFSLDGITGCSVIEYAREAVGRGLAEDMYASRFWSQGGGTKGALSTDGKLTDAQRDANSKAWQDAQGGWWNSHKVAVLEGGLKWQQIGISPRDAQYLEGRQFSVSDIARWFGVPPHMVGDVDRSTSWGSGIEQQQIGFLITSLDPWLTLWEQDTDRQILEDDDEFFAEFLRDAMLRADSTARGEYYSKMINAGVMSRNEVRIKENLNPLAALEDPLLPLNMSPARAMDVSREQAEVVGDLVRAGFDPEDSLDAVGVDADLKHTGALPVTVQPEQGAAPPSGFGGGPPPADDAPASGEAADARAQSVVLRAATRAVRLEVNAIAKRAPRYAGNTAGWRQWVADFYGKHVAMLEENLGLDQAAARLYGAAHTAALLEQGVGILTEWTHHAPALLTAMALGEETTWPAASLTS